MQVEGVDGKCVSDVESLLLVTHVGAADRCLPQAEVGVLRRQTCRETGTTELAVFSVRCQTYENEILLITRGDDTECM